MASQIKIISGAMVLIGANPISSLSEGTEGRVAAELYDDIYEGVLSSFRWRFATKQVLLSRLTETPLNTYDYQYQLPTDLVMIIKGETADDYEIYGDKLYSNLPSVSIDYVHKVDETLLPPYFTLMLKYLLAASFAIPVTDNATKAQTYATLYETQFRIAKNIDSTQRPSVSIQDSPLTDIN